MAAFEDFMASFRHDPEHFNEAEFKAAALAAYQEDINGVNSVVSAKDTEISELKAKNTEIGAANWQMLINRGGVPVPPPTNDSGADPEAEEPKTVGSLFTKVERK